MPKRYNDLVLQETLRLIEAMTRGDDELASRAIHAGADVNCRIIKTPDGFRIASDVELAQTMRSACQNTHYDLIQPVPEVIEYEVPMADTTTLLNVLALNKNSKTELARLLMDNGAELGAIDYASHWESWGKSAENYFQNTPLLNAIATNNLDFAHLYLDYLARLDKESQKEILDYKDKFCAGFHTALEFAIRRGFSGLATRMVHMGANPNPQPFIFSYAGKSPLHMACMSLGQAWDPKSKEWILHIGSDLELILALLECGADYTLLAETQFYNEKLKWDRTYLRPFYHVDISLGKLTEPVVSFADSCQEPAFHPRKTGQIKHPFHEEHSFRCPQIEGGSRVNYLKSKAFLKNDKEVLQKAVLARIVKDCTEHLGGEPMLSSELINELSFNDIIGLIADHPNFNWVEERFRQGGLFYNMEKVPHLSLPIPPEQNPIATLALRNKITRCPINEYRSVLAHTASLRTPSGEQSAANPMRLFSKPPIDPDDESKPSTQPGIS